PYRPKRKTRASTAIENGLQPLAEAIFSGREADPLRRAAAFVSDKVENAEAALQGARDIIAEWISENSGARNKIRGLFERGAVISSKVKKKKEAEATKYKDYFDFSESLNRIPSHRLLAIRRGEEEGFLSVDISPDENRTLEVLDRLFLRGTRASTEQIEKAITDSYKRLLKPSIETEFANLSKEKADAYAIKVFSENLRQLLVAPPLG